ncbi:MAG: hypothetical protein U5J63_05915 [Fodinibius sp.]|nr:hypothetical protein [Fodinibius sp.]
MAVIVHFTVYYGQIRVPFSQADGENPGVAAALAIICAVAVGFSIYAIKGNGISLRREKAKPVVEQQ